MEKVKDFTPYIWKLKIKVRERVRKGSLFWAHGEARAADLWGEHSKPCFFCPWHVKADSVEGIMNGYTCSGRKMLFFIWPTVYERNIWAPSSRISFFSQQLPRPFLPEFLDFFIPETQSLLSLFFISHQIFIMSFCFGSLQFGSISDLWLCLLGRWNFSFFFFFCSLEVRILICSLLLFLIMSGIAATLSVYKADSDW